MDHQCAFFPWRVRLRERRSTRRCPRDTCAVALRAGAEGRGHRAESSVELDLNEENPWPGRGA